MSVKIGVNVDHVATVRNARGENHPDPYSLALNAIKCGADSITIHLREDRRHIKDKDLKIIASNKLIPLNLEIASNIKMLKIALMYKPNYVCIVPEKRNEVTTEGGLNLKKNKKKIKFLINELNNKNIRTSLFINPVISDIKLAKSLNSKCIEIHTGKISNQIKKNKYFLHEYKKIRDCCNYAKSIGLKVHAGHGIDYKTAKILCKISIIEEFNIGHFIIGESIFYGINKTLKNFINILK